MRYFHVPLSQICKNQVKIRGGELHHLADVVRLREGSEITVLDGSGGIYEVILISCRRDVAVGEIRAFRQVQPSTVEVTLLVGLPKADKMDMIVQKATELGAHRIVPVLCQHTVPHLSEQRLQQRFARWQQIAIEASKQSRRPYFSSVSHILSFGKALEESRADLKLIFVTFSVSSRLKDVLKQTAEAKKVDIFIGPEGDFTEEEIRLALSAGVLPVMLGSNILRTETAAIAALAVVLYEIG